MSFNHGGTIFAAARELGCSPSEILDFSASINPLGLSPSVRKACIDSLDQAVHYPDPYATLLTEKLAEKHGISANCIVPANGSTALIHLLPAVTDGSSALIVAPAFSEYADALSRHHWNIEYHLLRPENPFNLDPD
jgi:threonine-phosphate decarboxylase